MTHSPNLELIRSIYAGLERGDYSSTDWAHADIDFAIVDGPTPGRWEGLDGMANAWRDFLSAWKAASTRVDEYRELGDARVLVLETFSARGRASGLEVGQLKSKGAALFQVRDGKVTSLTVYWDRDRALAELGLASKTGSDA